jgi:sirohydrochlorin ferrochelatase
MNSERYSPDANEIGIIIVDHGSSRAESNQMLLEVVRQFERASTFRLVEPAHMERAEPSLGTAFDRCVERGAKLIVIHPYFLLPGQHWDIDIPSLAREAASRHAGVSYLVTAPLGLHPLITEIIQDRVRQCLDHAHGTAPACQVCEGTSKCRIRPAEAGATN